MSKSAIVDKLLHTGREWRNLRLTLSSWNTCGLSQERLDYVLLDRAYDVSVLNELHGAHTLRASRNFITCGEPKAGDPAAGVGIALSNKAASLCYELRAHWCENRVGQATWVHVRYVCCGRVYTSSVPETSAVPDRHAPGAPRVPTHDTVKHASGGGG